MTSKKILYLNVLAIFGLLSIPSAHAQNAPIVLELFTSKYCPACPRADKNINAIAKDNPDVITISCHVTYFDRGNRKDELAHPFCNARQGIYKLALKTGAIYTPMTIINGQSVSKGLNISDIQSKRDQTRTPQNIGLRHNGQYLGIAMPQMRVKEHSDLWLFELEKKSYEKGYTQYRNSVRKITKLLRWDGKRLNMAFPVGTPDPNTSYVLIAQNYRDGIIAAAQTP